jgi:hypothetical protein
VPAGRSTTPTAALGLARERLCGPAGTRPGVAPQRIVQLQVGLPSPVFSSALQKGVSMPVMIGVDPHKASHTAAALDAQSQLLDHKRFPATLEGYQALRQWAGRWEDRRWAVEGAHGVGRPVAQRLVADGQQVLDVPAKLAARVRVLSTGHGRKTDQADAVSVAVAARNAPRCGRSASRTTRWCCIC